MRNRCLGAIAALPLCALFVMSAASRAGNSHALPGVGVAGGSAYVMAAGGAAQGMGASDPWNKGELVQPSDLAAALTKAGSKKPVVLYVGFPVLYRSKHVAGAINAGQGSRPDGLDEIKKQIAGLSKTATIYIYCGCCPFVKCPNIRPAYRLLHDEGFKNVKVVYMETNFHVDWATKGYPVEGPASGDSK